MLYWVGGTLLVIVLLFFAARWLLRASDLRGFQELRPVPRAQLEEQLTNILEANRALSEETRIDARPGLVMFVSPLWRCSADRQVLQSMTPLPERFFDYSFGPEAERLLDEDAWDALVDVAEVMKFAPRSTQSELFEYIDTYEADLKQAPELVPRGSYRAGDRALSLLLLDFQRCLAAGATVRELRQRWCDPTGSAPSLVQKLDQIRELEAIALMEVLSQAAAGGAPASETDSVRLRFYTPGRVARHQALMLAVAEQHDVDSDAVEGISTLQVEISGLPSPIDFVRDLGVHVSPLINRDIDGQTLSLAALRALGLSNLAAFGPQPELPSGQAVILEDADDHGAAKVLLVPDMLPDDGRVWAVAPAHACLVLFDRDDPEQVADARAYFESAFERGGQDAPLPDPIEITPAGFTPSSWP